MQPTLIPQEPGCLVRQIQRGRKGPAKHPIDGIAYAGVEVPDIFEITLWIGGRAYTTDLKSDLLNLPPPNLELACHHFRDHPERWAAVHVLKSA